jgi:hypothetical protein
MSRQKANRYLCVPKGVEGHPNDESSARSRSSTPKRLDKRTANSQEEDRALVLQTACGAFCHRYLQVLRRTYLRDLNYLPCKRCNLLEPSTDHSDYVRLRQIATSNPRPYPNRDLGLRPVSCKRNPQARIHQYEAKNFFHNQQRYATISATARSTRARPSSISASVILSAGAKRKILLFPAVRNTTL